jgi:CRISPR-associated endonuclease Csn1
MKKILGLDLGTNSIGWAVVNTDDKGRYTGGIKLGSRIIPMSQDVLGNFDSGTTKSQTAERTSYRSTRRLIQRRELRREQLFRVLHTLGFLPFHFDNAIGWNPADNRTYGKFIIPTSEPKIAWDGRRFLFMDSFAEMLADFTNSQPDLVANGRKVPYDWTIYYLRKKALEKPITRQELAWIILNFNQKRGYYQLRDEVEEEKKENQTVEYAELKIIDVTAEEPQKGKPDIWYNLTLEDGRIYRRRSKKPLYDWKDKTRAFIITTDYNEDGTVKKESFSAPKEDDWMLVKKKTENDLLHSGKTVGTFIYDTLLAQPDRKIIGSLVRTIERDYYKKELIQILSVQSRYIPELTSPDMAAACLRELFPGNIHKRKSFANLTAAEILIHKIIFYQRPLKSKKSLIDNCPYEIYHCKDETTQEILFTKPVKCIPKSNPYFQEFRLRQFISNLRIYERTREVNGRLKVDYDATAEYLPDAETYDRLYIFLNERAGIDQTALFTGFFNLKAPKRGQQWPIRWNYVEDKAYPCNETRASFTTLCEKNDIDTSFLDVYSDNPKGWGTYTGEYHLWHILYSVSDRKELNKALVTYAARYDLPETFVEAFTNMRPFKSEYGAYSEKAIKKLLEPMRKGSPVYESCYAVYKRHSESTNAQCWTCPEDIDAWLADFRQHSMRNPIVEQVIMETMRTVRDIWRAHGQINEIHLEMGRSMKSNAKQREAMTQRNLQNEATNLRIKCMLMEMKEAGISAVRPWSPTQQEILRIYEEGALLEADNDTPADILDISTRPQPSPAELTRYRLWMEQKYRSPYTGRPISLARLFTTEYEIEHIIPQSRYIDDSLSNKVICEAEINKLKTNMLGMEFITKHHGEVVQLGGGVTAKVLSVAEYKELVKTVYKHNPPKMKKLLMDDLPAEFIQRQMNDSRYISRAVKSLLSHIVREEGEEEVTSKNVIVCTGAITDRLKKDWGLNDVWNSLVCDRFQRLNDLTDSQAFGYWDNKDGHRVFQTQVPLELSRGFSKKRIDHRHHALDALAIACASRNIINYLSNVNAASPERYDLRAKLIRGGMVIKPWDTITQDARKALEEVVVSFKQNTRVLTRTSNRTQALDEQGRHIQVTQTKGDHKAIRKPLHKQTVFAHVNLRRKRTVALKEAIANRENIVDKELKAAVYKYIEVYGFDVKGTVKAFKENGNKLRGRDVSRVEVYYYTDDVEPQCAVRKAIDETITLKQIESITDTCIRDTLLNYLKARGGDPKEAFSPEGLEDMNANITLYTPNHKPHKPIRKARFTESMGQKFPVGQTGNNPKKFVEAEKGTNLFFGIYETEDGSRSYATIPLNVVIERLKQGETAVPEVDDSGTTLKFSLSPNDLVYVPNEEERMRPVQVEELDKKRIYKMVSSSGPQCFFIRSTVATPIVNKMEYSALNKMEREAVDDKQAEGQMIKSVCWKLQVDRLGNIIQIIR